MSSSPTGATSTTASSATSLSGPEAATPSGPEAATPYEADARRPLAIIACGALAPAARRAARQLEVGSTAAVEVHSLSALLHNRPADIATAVEGLARELAAGGRRAVVAYADCGTYGALDAVCERLAIERLPGLHCYDLVAGADTVAALFDDEPGTYLLTDFLVKSFGRLVVRELGLDRHPELAADYFGHYRRVVWLAERPTPGLRDEAEAAAALLGLPLEIQRVDGQRLGRALVRLATAPTRAA